MNLLGLKKHYFFKYLFYVQRWILYTLDTVAYWSTHLYKRISWKSMRKLTHPSDTEEDRERWSPIIHDT